MKKRLSDVLTEHYFPLFIIFGTGLIRFLRIKGGALVFDDSFITFRYAANLANGLGFVYNPGERVLGTTTPLWALILAGTQFFKLDIILGAQILSLLFDIGTCLLLYKMLSTYNASAGKWAALIWIIYPPAVYAATGGMETSLFVFLNVASFYLISRKIFNPLLRLAAPLAILVRPEGIIIFLINLYDVYKNDPHRIRSLSWSITLPVIWAVFATLYFGTPIPLSVIAKRANVDNSAEVFEILSGIFSGETVLLLPFMIVGLLYLLKKRQFPHIMIWLFAYIGLYLLGKPKMWVWYFLPMQMGVIVISSFGITFIIEFISDVFKRYSSSIRTGLTVTGMIAVFMMSVYYFMPSEFNAANDEFSRFRSLALYVKENTSSGDAILASDIGYLGYYADRVILDTWGLVWPPALDFDGDNAQKATKIAEHHSPAAIVIPYKRDFYEQAISSDHIKSNYYLDTIFAEGQIDISQLEPSAVPEKWSARYLVFLQNNRENKITE